jgi:hypothetical protein
MFEFADIFAYGLTTTIYLSGSIAMLLGLALSVAAMTHNPDAEAALQVLPSA